VEFKPTETVTEKRECVNGSVRRLLPLFTELPRRVVFLETGVSVPQALGDSEGFTVAAASDAIPIENCGTFAADAVAVAVQYISAPTSRNNRAPPSVPLFLANAGKAAASIKSADTANNIMMCFILIAISSSSFSRYGDPL
jgi:hypothetical protein